MNRVYAAEYLGHFQISIDDVGDVVSEGTQHYTCHYRQNQVIKIPKDSIYMRTYRPLRQQALTRDLQILNERLKPYTIPTEILSSERGYVIVQDFASGGEYITVQNFMQIAGDFNRVVEINRSIVRDYGLSIDFFGSYGFRQTLLATLLRNNRRAMMTNLLAVLHDDRWTLKIVDVNLSELRWRYRGQIGLLHWAVDTFAYYLSRMMIADHFGVRF